jgi:hypothetical protein
MLTIRYPQMIALQAASFKQRYDMERIVSMIIDRLRQMNILGTPSQESEGTREGEGEYSEAEKLLRRQVREEVDQALLFGIISVGGLTQYVSYRFMLSPDWHKDREIRKVLERPGIAERERLSEVHRLLQ